MDNNRWTHKLTMWDPREGRRNVGRQRTRWADQLKNLRVTNGLEVRKTERCGKNLKKLYRTCSPIGHTRTMPCSKSRRPCPFRDVWLNSFIHMESSDHHMTIHRRFCVKWSCPMLILSVVCT